MKKAESPIPQDNLVSFELPPTWDEKRGEWVDKIGQSLTPKPPQFIRGDVEPEELHKKG